MPHYRKEYRDGLSAALTADAVFDAFTPMPAYAQNIDARILPVLAVSTPREKKDRDSLNSSARITTVAAIFKVLGGDDLEDTLDDLSVAVERVTLAALEADNRECLLTDTQLEINGDGGNRVGTLTMFFAVTAWLSEPLDLS